jgi:hypothetical protein
MRLTRGHLAVGRRNHPVLLNQRELYSLGKPCRGEACLPAGLSNQASGWPALLAMMSRRGWFSAICTTQT